jgi:hypothetical protein
VKRRHFISLAGISLAGAFALQAEMASAEDRHRAADFDPLELGLAALRVRLEQGLSSAALVTAYLERIARLDQAGPAFRSVLAINPLALQTARTLDAERRRGVVRGPLHGIPLLIKDNIATLDPLPTTAGSLALARSLHTVDAPLVARLRAAGAIVLGKANLSEWANFRSTRSISGWSAIGGQTGNAYDPLRSPSGSSSGSATAVALSLCAAGRRRSDDPQRRGRRTDRGHHPRAVADRKPGGSRHRHEGRRAARRHRSATGVDAPGRGHALQACHRGVAQHRRGNH